MTFLPYIIEFFLRSKPQQPTNIISKVIGYILITIGCIYGFFLAFQFLSPDLNNMERGAILSMILVIIGGILLYMAKRHKKVVHPVNDLVNVTTDLFKNFELKNLLQNNATKIASLALLVGFVLSQLGGIKRR